MIKQLTAPELGAILCVISAIWIASVDRAYGKTEHSLPSRDSLHAMETAESALRGISRQKDDLFLIPADSRNILKSPISLDESTPLKRFGQLIQTKRFKMPSIFRDSQWVGIEHLQRKILMLDGKGINTAIFDAETMELISKHSVIYDLVRPAPDRGGEPTKVETAQLRSRFVKAVPKVLGNPMNGMAKLPKSWWRTKDEAFLVLSAIPDFPFLIMECTKDDLSRCMITRSCFTQGLETQDRESWRGLAIDAKKKIIAIGNAKRHRVEFLKFSSCMSIKRLYALELPPKIKNISGLHIDDDELLWMTSTRKDDYFNASVFFWHSKEWRR